MILWKQAKKERKAARPSWPAKRQQMNRKRYPAYRETVRVGNREPKHKSASQIHQSMCFCMRPDEYDLIRDAAFCCCQRILRAYGVAYWCKNISPSDSSHATRRDHNRAWLICTHESFRSLVCCRAHRSHQPSGATRMRLIFRTFASASNCLCIDTVAS